MKRKGKNKKHSVPSVRALLSTALPLPPSYCLPIINSTSFRRAFLVSKPELCPLILLYPLLSFKALRICHYVFISMFSYFNDSLTRLFSQ